MTQNQRILNLLKAGYFITPMKALELFQCFRLGARILDLRRKGYDIKTEMITVNEKTFARYYLATITKEQLKEQE